LRKILRLPAIIPEQVTDTRFQIRKIMSILNYWSLSSQNGNDILQILGKTLPSVAKLTSGLLEKVITAITTQPVVEKGKAFSNANTFGEGSSLRLVQQPCNEIFPPH